MERRWRMKGRKEEIKRGKERKDRGNMEELLVWEKMGVNG